MEARKQINALQGASAILILLALTNMEATSGPSEPYILAQQSDDNGVDKLDPYGDGAAYDNQYGGGRGHHQQGVEGSEDIRSDGFKCCGAVTIEDDPFSTNHQRDGDRVDDEEGYHDRDREYYRDHDRDRGRDRHNGHKGGHGGRGRG